MNDICSLYDNEELDWFWYFLNFLLSMILRTMKVCIESEIQFTSKSAQPILIKTLQTTTS